MSVAQKTQASPSRVAKQPIALPKGVELTVDKNNHVIVKGPKGELSLDAHKSVSIKVKQSDDASIVEVKGLPSFSTSKMHSGTVRAICNNMVLGVSQGFEKKLVMIGVGYRAAVQGKKITLTVGKSHPDIFEFPEGITAECPSQTEIVIKGADKQLVGQVAAKIREFRPPEPYKGKGIRYVDEYVIKKEAKK